MNADVICLVEYLTDAGIEENLKEKYWFEESDTVSGNKVFIAVKKKFAPNGIKVINKSEEKECYNFLHVEFSMQNGELLSIIGVRMLSPIDASKQTPPLKKYLLEQKTPFLCAGDFNIKDCRMTKWFSGISTENIVNTNCHLYNSSIIYVDKNSHKVMGYGAVDHVLHSDNISVSSKYDWSFLSCDEIYPCVDTFDSETIWNIPAAYPDHALMISNVDINP